MHTKLDFGCTFTVDIVLNFGTSLMFMIIRGTQLYINVDELQTPHAELTQSSVHPDR
jgi:hypothetical protein